MTPNQRIDRIEKEIRGGASLFGVNSWEKQFMADIKSRQTLTQRQEDVLAGIEKKVFEESGDD